MPSASATAPAAGQWMMSRMVPIASPEVGSCPPVWDEQPARAARARSSPADPMWRSTWHRLSLLPTAYGRWDRHCRSDNPWVHRGARQSARGCGLRTTIAPVRPGGSLLGDRRPLPMGTDVTLCFVGGEGCVWAFGRLVARPRPPLALAVARGLRASESAGGRPEPLSVDGEGQPEGRGEVLSIVERRPGRRPDFSRA